MPSVGGVEFMQSFVCNLRNDCQKNTPGYKEARQRYVLVSIIYTILYLACMRIVKDVIYVD